MMPIDLPKVQVLETMMKKEKIEKHISLHLASKKIGLAYFLLEVHAQNNIEHQAKKENQVQTEFSQFAREFSQFGREFSQFAREFSQFAREFSQFAREFSQFAREFSQFAREFSQFAREFSQFAREPEKRD